MPDQALRSFTVMIEWFLVEDWALKYLGSNRSAILGQCGIRNVTCFEMLCKLLCWLALGIVEDRWLLM
jgi:hypothetical protein